MNRKIFVFFIPLFILTFLIFIIPAFAQTKYQAERIEQSCADIPKLNAGQDLEFWVKFKNIGEESWAGSGPEAVVLRTVSGMKSKLSHPTWYSYYIPNRVNPVSTIFPGDEALFRFNLNAPKQDGIHWETFQLYAGTNPIPGGEIEIAVQVSGNGVVNSESTPTPTPIPTPTPTPAPTPTPNESNEVWWQSVSADINIVSNYRWGNLEQGPNIEVGLIYIEKKDKTDYLPFRILTLNNTAYNLYDQFEKLLVRNTSGEMIEIDYNFDSGYFFVNDSQGKRLLMTNSPLVLKSSEPVIFRIDSWKNGPFWGADVNDNEFRTSLELKYNSSTQRLWLINKLPMEEYLRGLSEVGDSSHPEFLKAQSIAGRTYAMFRYYNHKYTNTTNCDPFFTVMATQADQVYRGYQKELRGPNALVAVEQTKGIIATYANEPISAYYFAQSDGKTRDSEKAYMTKAPVPYLKAKNDPPGQGKTMLGHGVGMPQIGGIVAANQGANYSQILKYYYTGIDLTKIY